MSADQGLQLLHSPPSDLSSSRLADVALKADEEAPSFVLCDGYGQQFSLEGLLEAGPVLIAFYHGLWCQSCASGMKALQGGAPMALLRRTSVIAISVQNVASSLKFALQNDLTFPVLSDPSGRVAAQFGLLYRLPPVAVRAFRDVVGVDLNHFTGEDSWVLPMVARYVIGEDGVVAYAEVNRAVNAAGCITDLLPVLDRLAQRSR